MAQKDILVIGSKGHKHADCVDWTDKIPYLGDYLLIILDLTTLTIQEMKKLCSNNQYLVLDKLKKQINEIIWAKAHIRCITNKNLYYHYESEDVSITNYDWCPVSIEFKDETGNKFDRERKGYLSYVESWTHYFNDDESDLSNKKGTYRLMYNKHVFFRPDEFLNNRANKKLAFSLTALEYSLGYNKEPVDIKESNPIYFYPPTTKISVKDGIDCLIEQILGVKEQVIKLPSWTEKTQFKKELELIAEMERSNKAIIEETKKLEGNRQILDNLIRFKGLLTEDGEVLEELVEGAFKLFGINLEKPEGKKEDRRFCFKEDIIPIEIKGKIASIPERDGLNQLIGRMKGEPPKNFKAHGVLIGNHYKETPLDEKLEGRKRAFEPDVVKKAEDFNCCLISTLEIFKFIDKKLSGEEVDREFQDRLFNTVGLGDKGGVNVA